jgi:hypothetical protein
MLRTGIVLFLGVVWVGLGYGYSHLLRHVFWDSELIISPFQIIAADGKERSDQLGEQLALMLQSRLRSVQAELAEAQQGLRSVDWKPDSHTGPTNNSKLTAVVPGYIIGTTLVDLPTAVLSTARYDVVVGGVQIGGIWPWLHKLLVQKRTLDLFVSYEGQGVLVTGILPGSGEFIAVPATTGASDIADHVAHALLKRALSEKISQLKGLDDDAFRGLVRCIVQLNALNERARNGGATGDKTSELFDSLKVVAGQVPDWYQVNYLAASLAEGAGKLDDAIQLYRRASNSATHTLDIASGHGSDAERNELIRRAQARMDALAPQSDQTDALALERIRDHAKAATRDLNRLFGEQLDEPQIEPEPNSFMNAIWNGTVYQVPPPVQYLPDITYHELAHRYLPSWEFQGQSGSLLESVADIIAVTYRQRMNHETAAKADWILARGFVGWLTSGDVVTSKPKGGLRSLSAPGTAYDDPVLGKDPQPSHMSKYVTMANTASGDFGGIHVNCGIPNKAFFEAAQMIGTERALSIWLDACRRLRKKTSPTFVDMATATVESATSAEQGSLRDAWRAVGVLTA